MPANRNVLFAGTLCFVCLAFVWIIKPNCPAVLAVPPAPPPPQVIITGTPRPRVDDIIAAAKPLPSTCGWKVIQYVASQGEKDWISEVMSFSENICPVFMGEMKRRCNDVHVKKKSHTPLLFLSCLSLSQNHPSALISNCHHPAV